MRSVEGLRWSNVVSCEIRVATFHVMWCEVVPCHVSWHVICPTIPSHPIAPQSISMTSLTLDDMTASDITWHDTTGQKQKTSHQTTSPHITWHDTSQLTTLFDLTLQPPSSKQVTSPARHITTMELKARSTKSSIWASQWLVALRTFYWQILSLAHISFPSQTSAPRSPGNYLNLVWIAVVSRLVHVV